MATAKNDKTYGGEIKQLRKKYSLTQAKLCKITGIPVRTIQDWEGDVRTPPGYVVMLLNHYLSTTIKDS